MNKALFWDFDGTLVYTSGVMWTNALYAALEKLGYFVDAEEIRVHLSSRRSGGKHKRFTWETPEMPYAQSAGQKWWDIFFARLASFYEEYNIPKGDADRANAYFKSHIIEFADYTLYEDAVDALRKCSEMGYNNYILSNNYPELPLVITKLGLSEHFAGCVVSANVGYEKPRAEIFQYAIGLANHPDVCYMIGDNPVADIQGGKMAGMKTILVHKEGDFEADHRCENLLEIPLLL